MFFTFVAVALSIAFTTSAWAQTKKLRDELPEHLRGKWDEAGELFDDTNYKAALSAYEAIYAETKNPRVLYNVGLSWKEQKHYALAVGVWQKQLALKDKIPQAEAERAQTAIESVRPFVTSIDLQSNQDGARIFVEDIEVGKTPLAGSLPIDVGPNKIVLEKQGFARVERTVEVPKDGPAKVVLNMVPAEKTAPAKIAVTGAPTATIFIDGIDMGPAPFEGEVPTGRHTFEAREKGYVSARQTSEVVFGEPVKVTLSMVKELNEGKIRIRTGHPDATIAIDGKVVGTGSWEGLLGAGGHTLEVKKSGYKTLKQEIALVSDQERTVEVDLEEDRGSAWIYWTVTGVLVAAGAATTCYFVFKPAETAPVTGTISPGIIPTLFRF